MSRYTFVARLERGCITGTDAYLSWNCGRKVECVPTRRASVLGCSSMHYAVWAESADNVITSVHIDVFTTYLWKLLL